jgi:NAD(P)-dependent dehydrogenase (short-subunit alcohol dehydrogenase family)
VLITGAAGGIGCAAAYHLASRGFLVFAGVHSPGSIAQLQQPGLPNLIPLHLDVTLPDTISAARNFIQAACAGRGLFGLVNNAGLLMAGPVEFLDLQAYRRLLEVNLLGAIAVTQSMLELLRTAQGRVINLSSLSGLDSPPFLGAYASSKFALEAISDSLRVELSIWKIKVILIEPGDVLTPMLETFRAKLHETTQALPGRAWELYGPVFEMAREMKPRGMPPERVARMIEQALVSPRPKARYSIGPEARIVRLLRLLPTSLRDWFMLHRLP